MYSIQSVQYTGECTVSTQDRVHVLNTVRCTQERVHVHNTVNWKQDMVYVLNTGSCTQKRVHVFNSVNCDQQKGTVSARNFTYVLVL